jgi:ADP-ribosylglycohydrolase
MKLIAGYNTPVGLLKAEVDQKEYEGLIVSESLKAEINALDEADAGHEKNITAFYQKLDSLSMDPDFDYVQPNDLEGIKKERPDGPRRLVMNLTDEELLDRFHGAWTGRACGCALGKPVEGMGMSEDGRGKIKKYLSTRSHWPLDYYFSGEKIDDLEIGCSASWRENIAYMEPDDDIHYTLIGLKVLENKGTKFQWYDVADCWNSSLPYNAICTAETQAILNYNMQYSRMTQHRTTAEFTSTNNNPYREWIGAQIRADGWAYCCAGNPELAAEFAWRDAHWTHTANGIYGEMFAAAVIAAAFVEKDPKILVEIGLSEIPHKCKLAEAIRQALCWIEECIDSERFMYKLDEEYEGMSAVHTVNNALICVMALFYGNMNPDKSICISVMGALDTDCNGATVGSIVGAASGKKNFGGKLADPLNDTIKPLVFGFQEITMKELAERTMKVYKRIR